MAAASKLGGLIRDTEEKKEKENPLMYQRQTDPHQTGKGRETGTIT